MQHLIDTFSNSDPGFGLLSVRWTKFRLKGERKHVRGDSMVTVSSAPVAYWQMLHHPVESTHKCQQEPVA